MDNIFYSPNVDHNQIGRYSELMDVEEVTDLQAGMDFRRPEFRREVFHRFYEFHLHWRAHPGGVYFVIPYLNNHFKWDREQKLWFAFLNGNTQNPVTSWLFFERFPAFQNLDIDGLETFFNKEWQRLAFDTDRRHQKKDFIKAVRCYKELCGNSQADYFSSIMATGDPYQNFKLGWETIRDKFYTFGRLATFSYMEYLRIVQLQLDCDNLFLEDMSGSKSHRNGLAKVLGRDDLDWHDSNPTKFDGKYTKEMLGWLGKEAALLLEEAKQRAVGKPWAKDVSYFTLESTFCTYKSWHRPNRRYPGVYLDMFHDRIKKAETTWPEEDLSIFWLARKRYLPYYLRLEDNPGDAGVKPCKQNHYRETGEVIMMDKDWSCFKNDYNDRCSTINSIMVIGEDSGKD